MSDWPKDPPATGANYAAGLWSRRNYEAMVEDFKAAHCSADSAQLSAANVRLEAKAKDGKHDWVEIFPYQLEWIVAAGHQVRAIEIDTEPQSLPLRGPDCACCEQRPRKDCTVPGCTMKDAGWALERSQAESVQREDQTPVSYQRRNIGPNGTPFSAWYPADDKPTPENMKFDGYLSYEYRPLYAGPPLTRPQRTGE
jgi:hypothetical protein